MLALLQFMGGYMLSRLKKLLGPTTVIHEHHEALKMDWYDHLKSWNWIEKIIFIHVEVFVHSHLHI